MVSAEAEVFGCWYWQPCSESSAHGQDKGGQRPFLGMHYKLKPVSQQGSEHQSESVFRCGARGFGDDVEVVQIQPGGALQHTQRVDVVGDGDEIDHGRVAEGQTVVGHGHPHVRIVAMGTDMDVGYLKGGRAGFADFWFG